jgi:hypothetical protein
MCAKGVKHMGSMKSGDRGINTFIAVLNTTDIMPMLTFLRAHLNPKSRLEHQQIQLAVPVK